MNEVRGPVSSTIHLVKGGRDRQNFPWMYQNTLCGRRPPTLGWYEPDHFPSWTRGELCASCQSKATPQG